MARHDSPTVRRLWRLIRLFDLHASGKWLLLSAVVGVVAGVAAISFEFLTQLVQTISLESYAGYHPSEATGYHSFLSADLPALRPWVIVVVMTAGGLLSGWLVATFAPEATGPGTDSAIEAFHQRRGNIHAKVPIIKALASAVTIGTGGSAGREGPIAQISAGCGSFLANRLKLSSRDRRVLLAAGMGAGVGAMFRSPLAGALFAGEILYRDAELESDVIVPAAVASVIGYGVFALALPAEMRYMPLFGNELNVQMSSFFELLTFGMLAIVLTLVGVAYVLMLRTTRTLFAKLPVVDSLKPAIGAALAGIIGIGLFLLAANQSDTGRDLLGVLGTGYGTLQKALSAGVPLGIQVLLAVAAVKILTTALTTSSGGSGGVFGPSMVIGGCLGAAAGKMFHTWWPGLAIHPQAYAIVGMAGFFAGVARAPLSTILMVTELTGSYRLLLPTLWVCSICFLLNRRWTLYENQVPTRVDSPAHRGDFIVDVLEGMHVRDVYRQDQAIRLVPEQTTLDEIVHALAVTSQRYFPVVDQNEKMVGIFSADDVRAYLYDDVLWKIANAGDIMVSKVVTVTPDDDLNTALRGLTAMNVDELPVVDPDDRRKLLGMVRRKELIAAYNQRILAHKQNEDA